MQIRELKLAELSKLQSHVYQCQFGGKPEPKALIFEFSGKYGIGSEGNRDADYMEAIASSWLTICNTNAVVFDLRNLEYEFGDRIWHVLRLESVARVTHRRAGTPEKVFPIAMVISDLCRSGFSTCKGMVPPAFDNLEEALSYVEAPARTYLETACKCLGLDANE